MTDANPAFDTVHPSGHILVRSCRGGYMHSVALSAEAMDTDGAHPLLQGWRRELAGDSLLRLLHGEVALRVLPRAPHVAEQPG